MEAVGQLTGGIAHDFNNMLAVVVGGLDLARRKLHGPRREVEYHLDNAMEGATRAAALTRRLLSFARAEPLAARGDRAGAAGRGDAGAGRSRARRADHRPHPRAGRGMAGLGRPHPARQCDPQSRRQRARRDGRRRRPRTSRSSMSRSRAGEVEALAAGDYVRIAVSRHRPRHRARASPPRVRALLHHQAARQGHRPRPLAAVRLRPPVGRRRHPRLDARRGHDRLALSAALAGRGRRGAGAAALGDPRTRPPRARRARARILVVEDDPRVARATLGALEELGHRSGRGGKRRGSAGDARARIAISIWSSPT